MNKLITALAHQSPELQSVHSAYGLLAGHGLDGEWFGSYDVEGYLKEKGISLDGDTTFCKVPENISPTELPPPGTVPCHENSNQCHSSPLYGVGETQNDFNRNGSWTFDVNLFVNRKRRLEPSHCCYTNRNRSHSVWPLLRTLSRVSSRRCGEYISPCSVLNQEQTK
ncbi:unnamed protein product [Aspergillus oryzae var. brunneus]|uniref:Unnamed protein product n=1 Tax=Aspergillus oryzae var. brunneus TaxID=332754 RepID=A0ABQ6KWI4_ASPOZ|nr:unnamed protein product [Aspergillus oryzae]GMG47871.1 unnamed protein product [Aspergillus oryzae var. brunneus]